MRKNQLFLMRKTYLKYLITKFRQKISYIAFRKKMTIVELFCTAIRKSYVTLVKEGSIEVKQEDLDRDNMLYDQMMSGSNVNALFKTIMKMNAEKINSPAMQAFLSEILNRTTQKEKNVKEIFIIFKNGIKCEKEIDTE